MKRLSLLLCLIKIFSIINANVVLADVPIVESVPIRLTPEEIGEANDFGQFGWSVAIDNNTLVIGAPGDNSKGDSTGAIHIFERDANNQWQWLTKKVPVTVNAGDEFGTSVAIYGDIIAAAADVKNVGKVYLFYRNHIGENNWGTFKRIDSPVDIGDMDDQDGFGRALALEEDTLAVGAATDEISGMKKGSASVFYRNQGGENNWGLVKKVSTLLAGVDSEFGDAISLSGNLLAVGAPLAGLNNEGRAFIFHRNQNNQADSWGIHKNLSEPDAQTDAHFGSSVSIDNHILAVGSSLKDTGVTNNGEVSLFYRNEGGVDNWGLKTSVPGVLQSGFFLGHALALHKGNLAAGSYGEDVFGVNNAGSAHVMRQHRFGTDLWGFGPKQISEDFPFDNTDEGDHFGFSVALSNTELVIGAPGQDSVEFDEFDSPGGVYIYEALTDLFCDGAEEGQQEC